MAAKCAISGQVPSEPVVSRKSGHVFERRLIEKHLKATGGVCPVTNQELTVEDLVPLQVDLVAAPRAPSGTSIPGLVKMFQSEWDAVMLESYTLKQTLHKTREELAQALYRHDAACRVIARLIRERDEARRALANGAAAPAARSAQQSSAAAMAAAAASSSSSSAAVPMEVDEGGDASAGDAKARLTDMGKALQAPRKARTKAMTKAAVAPAQVGEFGLHSSQPLHSTTRKKRGIAAADVLLLEVAGEGVNDSLVATGGVDGEVIVFDRKEGSIVQTLSKLHSKPIEDVCFFSPSSEAGAASGAGRAPLLFVASQDHTVSVLASNSNVPGSVEFAPSAVLSDHTDAVTSVSVHPSGCFLTTASLDGSVKLYDCSNSASVELLHSMQEEQPVPYSCARLHPDGLLLAAATPSEARVRIFDVSSQSLVASLEDGRCEAGVTVLAFSRNGKTMATGDEQGNVFVWDLKSLKMTHTAQITAGKPVAALRFDPSGRYLAAAAGSEVKVFTAKKMTVVLERKDHRGAVTSVLFGMDAKFFASAGADRTLKLFG